MTRRFVLSTSTSRAAVGLALWGVTTYGVLGLARLRGDGGAKVLCGPWGCLPPLQALAAAHGFWVMVIIPTLAWASNGLSRRGLARLGGVLVAVGGLGIATAAARSMMTWGPLTPEQAWWHPVLHAAFDLAMLVDVPLVELVAAGTACLVIARTSTTRAAASEATETIVPGTINPGEEAVEGRHERQPT